MYDLTAAKALALWAALHLVLLLLLSGRVVRLRRRHRVAIGDAGVPELTAAQRAFGNAAEYIGPTLGGLAALVLVNAPALLIHGVGALFFAGRVLHGYGMSQTVQPGRGRVLGMMLTYTALIALVASLVVYLI
ncbi:MAPEG family protein [Brevundimonas sp. 2R-24]|uniref:MAPEG family protein n=1 Tax=Peiella sedimenti TaxID=3061083 RepID=A0ABT8SJN1_9CAUL|nr:MAPEG family protein [Caulobacteraceae bacterium XZ-24]